MPRTLQLVMLLCCTSAALGLICFNCSETQTSTNYCAGDFAPPFLPFNSSSNIANCSQESTMCFVRSWHARARHAWIVQRGCYHSSGGTDPLVQLMNKPIRAMSCTQRRLSDAEYKVCLCQSNWCNSSPSMNSESKYFILYILIILYVINFQFCGTHIITLIRGPFIIDVSL